MEYIPENIVPEDLTKTNANIIEKALKKEPKIKFKHSVKIATLGDIMYYLFSQALETYYENDEDKHCDSNASRSFEDCYLLALYYKINISFFDLVKAGHIVLNKNDWFCDDVNRWVHGQSIKTKSEMNKLLDTAKLNAACGSDSTGKTTNMARVLKLETISDQILAQPKVRLQGVLRHRKETLSEFLRKFFVKFNNENPTILATTRVIDTPVEKRRSFDDIYKLAKYYYPDCTIGQVRDIVYKELFQTVPRFRSSYCNQIHKRVFYQGTESQKSGIFNREDDDQFGLKWASWLTLKSN